MVPFLKANFKLMVKVNNSALNNWAQVVCITLYLVAGLEVSKTDSGTF